MICTEVERRSWSFFNPFVLSCLFLFRLINESSNDGDNDGFGSSFSSSRDGGSCGCRDDDDDSSSSDGGGGGRSM